MKMLEIGGYSVPVWDWVVDEYQDLLISMIVAFKLDDVFKMQIRHHRNMSGSESVSLGIWNNTISNRCISITFNYADGMMSKMYFTARFDDVFFGDREYLTQEGMDFCLKKVKYVFNLYIAEEVIV